MILATVRNDLVLLGARLSAAYVLLDGRFMAWIEGEVVDMATGQRVALAAGEYEVEHASLYCATVRHVESGRTLSFWEGDWTATIEAKLDG